MKRLPLTTLTLGACIPRRYVLFRFKPLDLEVVISFRDDFPLSHFHLMALLKMLSKVLRKTLTSNPMTIS